MEELGEKKSRPGLPPAPRMAISRRVVIGTLAGVTVLLVIVAVLVTLLVTARVGPPGPNAAEQPGRSPSPSATAEPFDGLPTVISHDSGEIPGLLAAKFDCPDSYVDFFAVLELSGDEHVLQVDGHDQALIEWTILNGYGTTEEVLATHKCVLDILGAPSGIVERMSRTRALDGTQSETWPGYQVTWTYHPDAGLDAVFSYANP